MNCLVRIAMQTKHLARFGIVFLEQLRWDGGVLGQTVFKFV